MKKALALCALLALTFSAAPALAQEDAEPARAAKTAETVVVTASRVPEKAKNVAASMTVISNEEIEKKQYRDVGALLRNHGFQVNNFTGNSSLSQIAIRGVRSSLMGTHGLDGSILVLLDGRRIGTDNLSMLPMVNVERIEIIRGPGAVQYGSSAVGGVINVITRRGEKTPKASAEAGAGRWDTYTAQADAAAAKGPFDFSGGVSYLTAHDYKYGGHRFANSGVNYKTSYSLNAGYTFLDEHRIGVTAVGVRADEIGSPGYHNNPANEYNDRAAYSVDAVYEGGWKDAGLFWKGRYFNGRNNYLNDEWDDAGSWNYFKSKTEYQGAQGQLTFSKGFLTLTGGMDWNRYDTNFQGAFYNPEEKSKYDNTALFMLAKLGLFDEKLILSGGLRYDEYTLEVNDKSKDLYRTTPSAGIAWHATDWLTVKSNYGESYRIPQAVELVGFTGMAMSYVGNPDLKPEKGKTIDAGFEVDHKGLNFGVTYFRTNYKRKIASSYDWATSSAKYFNLDGKTKYRGLEIAASYDLGEAFDQPFVLRPYVNLTRMLKHRDQTGAKAKYVADLDLAYGVNFQHPEWGLDVDLRFTYFGKQDTDDFNAANDTYGRVVEIGGKTTIDLFVSQTIKEWEDAGKLSVKAQLLNMGNARVETIKDYPSPGRSFYFGLRYDY